MTSSLNASLPSRVGQFVYICLSQAVRFSMLDGSQAGRGDYFSGVASGSVRPSTDTPSHLLSNRNHNDFSPHFLAAAAAASAQAEAARAAGRLPSSSSSSSTLQPSSSISPAAPLPYLDQRTPFPVALGSRVVKSKQSQVSDRKGKAREGAEELGRVRCCEYRKGRYESLSLIDIIHRLGGPFYSH